MTLMIKSWPIRLVVGAVLSIYLGIQGWNLTETIALGKAVSRIEGNLDYIKMRLARGNSHEHYSGRSR